MQGVVYFGHYSIDIREWSDTSVIDSQFDQICNLMLAINDCSYAISQVPVDWYSEKIDGKDFYEWLSSLFDDKQDLLAHFYKKLHDGVFNNCIDKKLTLEQSLDNLLKNNPDSSALKYFGAMGVHEPWPKAPEEFYISNKQTLYDWGLYFLVKHPISEISYSDRCSMIFSNVKFHGNFKNSLTSHGVAGSKAKYGNAKVTGILGFSISVTRVLDVLNNVDLSSGSTQQLLSLIKAKTQFDCSPEGKNNAHLKLDWGNGIGQINCEFHVKINESNNKKAGDNTNYQDRLYFGFASFADDKKVFVYHSGQHL